MIHLKALIMAALLTLSVLVGGLLAPASAEAGFIIPKVTFYLAVTSAPVNATIWSASWTGISIGPLAPNQIAKIYGPRNGDPTILGNDRLTICFMSGSGVWSQDTCMTEQAFFQVMKFKAVVGYLHVFDCHTGRITTQKLPAGTRTITQPQPYVTVALSVVNPGSSFHNWGLFQRGPWGEWLPNAKPPQLLIPTIGLGNSATITIPAVCAIIIIRYERTITTFQVFDFAVLDNGKSYQYDFQTYTLRRIDA